MRLTILSALAALSLSASAQTYFYVDQIAVQPANPTSADVITVDLTGNFAGGGVSVLNTSTLVVGNQVNLTVNCVDNGGITVLIQHTETLNLGTLAAGTYTITLSGSGMGDFAPAPQHQFTVTGNGACDSLLINSISWAPFSDTAVIVSASNYSATLFDYPGFVLLDDQGDTIARETVNSFGIGQGPQPHVLTVLPGANIPPSPFTGTLDLWTMFYTAPGCSFTETIDLCPPSPCQPLEVWMANTGGAIVTATFNYSIEDANATIVASGTITMDAITQYASDTACLPPGQYTLSLVLPNPVGGALTYGMNAEAQYGPSESFVQGGAVNELPFPFYPGCINGPNGINEGRTGTPLTATIHGSILTITAPEDLPLGTVDLIDAAGRIVQRSASTNATCELDLASIPTGLLTVRCTRADGTARVVRAMNIR